MLPKKLELDVVCLIQARRVPGWCILYCILYCIELWDICRCTPMHLLTHSQFHTERASSFSPKQYLHSIVFQALGFKKIVPVVIITIGAICFQLNLIQKIFMGLSEQILLLHIIASRATCPVSKQPGSILAGKGAAFKLFFSNELSFRAINRRVNTIWRLYIRGGGEMIVLRFSFSTRVPFYGVSLCPYSKFHVGRRVLPFCSFQFKAGT